VGNEVATQALRTKKELYHCKCVFQHRQYIDSSPITFLQVHARICIEKCELH
jgi:hypothetical protein